MDTFYIKNAALYRKLVKAANRTPPPRIANVGTETSPDMIVSARIRPLLEEDIAAGFPCAVFPRSEEAGVVDVHNLYNHPRGRPILKSSNYEVDKLFGSETTTEEIYENLVVPLLPFAWDGGIGTLFTYGQTGSGKTFTVSRLEQLVAESLTDGSFEGQRQVYITIVDLSGNSAFDLLNSRQPISILEDSFGVTQLVGVDEHLVRDRDEVMDLIERAASFRRTASTFKNDASSRSHAICRIRIHSPSTDTDGFLYLIDLAGSEAARDIATHGADRMRETRDINMSLSVLKDCIRGKVEADLLAPKSKQKKPHIPFRQSGLTKVLKHVFDPATSRPCKTVVIACINPSLADVVPSRNTLRYAELLRVFVPKTEKVDPNTQGPMMWTNSQLKEWTSKNSGTPPIQPNLLSPTESGVQLLRLPTPDFETRCLKTPNVTLAQVKAFRSKIWQLHIDSQRQISTNGSSTPSEMADPDMGAVRSSSRDPNPAAKDVPFKERIRPGMVVSWTRPETEGEDMRDEGMAMGVILSLLPDPASGDDVNSKENENDSSRKYLCTLVTPAFMADAYDVNLWRQVVVDVEMMEKEVILEYDTWTRYYYICV